MFTQPLMYSVVKGMQPVRDLYRKQLIDEGIEEAALEAIDSKTWARLEEAYKKSKTVTYQAEEWATKQWDAIKDPEKYGHVFDTGVPVAELTELGKKISVLPENEKFHPQL